MNKSIARLLFVHFLIVAFLPIGFVSGIWILDEIHKFSEETTELRSTYMEKQQTLLKQEVNNALTFIEFKRSQTEERLKADIKARVYEAYAIANSLYQTNKVEKSPEESKQLIKNALRDIRFNQGRGYYFIVNLNGVEELYPVAPQFEGQNLLDLQDVKGNYVIRDEIHVIQTQQEGFVTDYWRKPLAGDEMIYPKITFVKHFPPLNWYIGAGEYLDDVEQDIQQEVLAQLASIRFGKDGYIFVNTYDGNALITDGEVVTEPKNLWELTDPNGVKVIQEERKAVENPEGGFIYYSWSRLDKGQPIPKMSFMRGVPEWEWMIGAGIYLDDIEREIQQKRHTLEQEIKHDILTIIFIVLSMLIIVFLNARYIAKRTSRHCKIFTTFFQRAATESLHIEKEQLYFSEFVALAEAANQMVDQQKQAEKALTIEKAYFEGLFENSPESVVIIDSKSTILRVNAEFIRFFGYPEAEIIGQDLDALIAPPERQAEAYQLTRRAWSEGKIFVETVRKRKDGTLVDVSVLSVPICGVNQDMVYAIYRDITEQKRAEKELQRLAMTDPLTGVYNRLHFNRALEEEIKLCQRYDRSFSLIMCDIDHFKQINDTYGHQIGDDVLVDIVSLIKKIIRETDIFARWGGEEFMILARNAALNRAANLAERTREGIESQSFQNISHVTCSFGVAQFHAEDDLEQITARVDQALYQAKEQGRNRVVCE